MTERRIGRRPGINLDNWSGSELKWVGFVCLCLSSFSIAVLQRGVMALDSYASTQELYEAMKPGSGMISWATAAVFCSLIATLAIPLYAKLLCEGFRHTSSVKRYILRLALCALVSEIPYDFAMNGKLLDFSVQNPVWALVVAAVMLAILRQWKFSSKAAAAGFSAVVVLAAVAWPLLLRVQLGPSLVLLTALFHFAGNRRTLAALAGAALTLPQFPAPFGVLLVHWYDGSKGKTDRRLFYVLYPAQLLAFGLWCLLLRS